MRLFARALAAALLLAGLLVPATPAEAGYWRWTVSECRGDVWVLDQPEYGSAHFWKAEYGTHAIGGHEHKLWWRYSRECGWMGTLKDGGAWYPANGSWIWTIHMEWGSISYYEADGYWYYCDLRMRPTWCWRA